MFLQAEIGTSKDNLASPIHNWYKFTAGFSYKLIEELVNRKEIDVKGAIYEPFAGCGTTLVQAQKSQIEAFGNEGQSFMYDIIQAKLNWNINEEYITQYLAEIKAYVLANTNTSYLEEAHPLLVTLYTSGNLNALYSIKNFILKGSDSEAKLFFKLALSQTLHKCSICPISSPYIYRKKKLKTNFEAVSVFEQIVSDMLGDLKEHKRLNRTSQIFLHDSRTKNLNFADDSCQTCITSPPYLNNLDYGEVSKVHTHFFDITKSWNDVTHKVRKRLVTASTTHYSESSFTREQWMKGEFYQANERIARKLLKYADKLEILRGSRSGKKSFDIMLLLYFDDMYHVLKEIRRIVSSTGKVYMILGDSAPYGIFIPTSDILGEIGQNLGLGNCQKYKIRSRGTKWATLTHRHKLLLDENVLLMR